MFWCYENSEVDVYVMKMAKLPSPMLASVTMCNDKISKWNSKINGIRWFGISYTCFWLCFRWPCSLLTLRHPNLFLRYIWGGGVTHWQVHGHGYRRTDRPTGVTIENSTHMPLVTIEFRRTLFRISCWNSGKIRETVCTDIHTTSFCFSVLLAGGYCPSPSSVVFRLGDCNGSLVVWYSGGRWT